MSSTKVYCIKKVICNVCEGIGKTKSETIYTCEYCCGKQCIRCERNGPYNSYNNCDNCYGCGTKYIDVDTNETVDLCSLNEKYYFYN